MLLPRLRASALHTLPTLPHTFTLFAHNPPQITSTLKSLHLHTILIRNMAGEIQFLRRIREQDKEATVYVGNLDERVRDELVWELMIQVGRVVNVHLPKDRVSQTHQGYGFVEFQNPDEAVYAATVMNGIRLYGKPIRVNKATADKNKTIDIGAELFIGNLDPMVDERTLYETFSRFGTLVSPPKACHPEHSDSTSLDSTDIDQVARDSANLSKGYGFVSYTSFEAADAAINSMHGQFLMNREVTVQYAMKKDGKGSRHGDEAERQLAAEAAKHGVEIPVQPMPPQLLAQPAPAPPTIPAGRGMGGPVQYPGYTGYPAGYGQPYLSNQLPPAPLGLPPRPPPSVGSFGGPPGFAPQGYGAANAPGFPPQQPSFSNGAPGAYPSGSYPSAPYPPGSYPPGSFPPGFPSAPGPPPPGGPPGSGSNPYGRR